MIVVSDSSPLIVLAKLGRLSLLSRLYPTVLISARVRDEVVTRGEGRAGSVEVAAASWIQVRALKDASSLDSAAIAFSLGLGEMSTILLGRELKADIPLIDEWKARRVAAASGFQVVGCAGLLERLFLRGHIEDLHADFRRLAELSYVDIELLNARLRTHNLAPI